MKDKHIDISKKIQPLADRVVICEQASEEKKTSAGIIIPVVSDKDRNGRRGEIVAVGPGRHEDGSLVKPSVKVGDTVVFQWGDKVTIGDREYYIVRESEILAIIK